MTEPSSLNFSRQPLSRYKLAQRLGLWFFAVLFAISAYGCVPAAVKARIDSRTLDAAGQTYQAMIVDKWQEGSGKSLKSFLLLQVPEDPPRIVVERVGAAFYAEPEKGKTIAVRSVPGRPDLFEVEPGSFTARARLSFGLALGGLLMCGQIVWRYVQVLTMSARLRALGFTYKTTVVRRSRGGRRKGDEEIAWKAASGKDYKSLPSSPLSAEGEIVTIYFDPGKPDQHMWEGDLFEIEHPHTARSNLVER